MSDHEQSLRQLAYRLWEESGCPEGRADEFWFSALEILTSETRPPEEPDAADAPATEAAAPESADTAQPAEEPDPAPRQASTEAESTPARKSSLRT